MYIYPDWITIRKMETADIPGVKDVIRSCFIAPVAERFCKHVDMRGSIGEGVYSMVAGFQAGIYGVLFFEVDKQGRMYMSLLGVHRSVQGCGLGRKMVEWLKGELTGYGSREVHLHVHERDEVPQGLYASCGFELIEIEPKAYSDGSAAHHMRYCASR